ncbi:MAG: ATP synthase F1 subunit epsilon [Pseudomonadota bacterium]|nr:ATP synthase F1 subunit epsilon [Pseudomonadota bacterium]|tara:strand:+ start:247 stop:642 length:396 start_codon:yes stop_codon:yes gene_type:complete
MADQFQIELVSPEKKVTSAKAVSVVLPGMEGDMTALPNHSTFLTSLRPGVLTVNATDAVHEYVVTGGFAEICGSTTTVLAERAILKKEITKEFLEALIEEAEEAFGAADSERKSDAGLRLNDIRKLEELFG